MNDQKNTPPKRAGVSRKIPRQERAARASVFTYAHGKETISTMRPKPAAVANLADLKVRELVQWRKERLGDGASNVYLGNHQKVIQCN